MLTINLLPGEEKKTVRLEERRRLMLFFASLFSSIAAVGIILLLPSYISMVFEREGLQDLARLEEEASSKLGVRETVVKTTNIKAVVSSIKTYGGEVPKASNIFSEFMGKPRSGVTISAFTSKKGGAFSLRGAASTRKDLLELEKSLRESGWFEDFASPISNIIRETDINFFIQGKIKP